MFSPGPDIAFFTEVGTFRGFLSAFCAVHRLAPFRMLGFCDKSCLFSSGHVTDQKLLLTPHTVLIDKPNISGPMGVVPNITFDGINITTEMLVDKSLGCSCC
jgi:hypothetical protein